MKIEMTQSHYADDRGFKLIGAGVHEVDEKRGQYLLSTFPGWFNAVVGEQDEEPTDTRQAEESAQEPEQEQSEASNEAPEPTKQENDEPEDAQNEVEAP